VGVDRAIIFALRAFALCGEIYQIESLTGALFIPFRYWGPITIGKDCIRNRSRGLLRSPLICPLLKGKPAWDFIYFPSYKTTDVLSFMILLSSSSFQENSISLLFLELRFLMSCDNLFFGRE
jgi:hypothetical protein